MFPCAYVLMTNKTQAIYKKVIHELKSSALSLGIELTPDTDL